MNQNKKIIRDDDLLLEAETLQFLGGVREKDLQADLRIYLGRGCKTWGDCKKICGLMPAPAPDAPIDF